MGCLLAPIVIPVVLGYRLLVLAGRLAWVLLKVTGCALCLSFELLVLMMEFASALTALTVAGVAAARAPVPAPIPTPRPRPRMPQNGRWRPQERPQAPVVGQGLVRGGTAMLTTRRSPVP